MKNENRNVCYKSFQSYQIFHHYFCGYSLHLMHSPSRVQHLTIRLVLSLWEAEPLNPQPQGIMQIKPIYRLDLILLMETVFFQISDLVQTD